MNEIENIVVSQKIKILREKIDQQKKILLEILEKWYYYRYIVQPRLIFEYEKNFGDLEEEIENRSTIALTLERRLELLMTKVRRGSKINRSTIDGIDRTANHEIHSKTFLNSTRREIFSPLDEFSDKNGTNSNEINKLYRILVKKLHPDVAGETELFKKFWVAIQDAYKEKNYQLIRIFYKTIADGSAPFETEHSLDYLQKLEEELKELKLMIGIERRMLERMLSKEPFIYEGKFNDPKWIEEHRLSLKKKIVNLENQIDFNQRLFSKMRELVERNND
ncbi:MAG: J domain-containing protein [Candidatus Kapaibacteriales bacterium]